MTSRNSAQKICDWSDLPSKVSNSGSPGLSDAREKIDFEYLARVLSSNNDGLLHLIGVGNPMRNDDGVGIQIITKLRKKCPHTREHFIIHSPSDRAESTISRINYEKDRVLIFDAVECNSAPGSILFTTLGDSRYGFFATHNIPLKSIPFVSSYPDRIFVLGIQTLNIQVGERLSRVVKESMEQTVDQLAKIIGKDH